MRFGGCLLQIGTLVTRPRRYPPERPPYQRREEDGVIKRSVRGKKLSKKQETVNLNQEMTPCVTSLHVDFHGLFIFRSCFGLFDRDLH